MIYSAMAVLDVEEISEADQNFTVNFFARCQWNDPAQAHAGPGRVVKGLDELWQPHIIFLNRQRLFWCFSP